MKPPKPAWLRLVAPKGSQCLVARVCACGRWVVEDRDGVWSRWDVQVLGAAELPVALILHRTLAELVPGVHGCRLVEVCGVHGLHADGQYLAAHDCTQGVIDGHAYKPPHRKTRRQDLSCLPSSSDIQLTADPWSRLLLNQQEGNQS